MNKAKDQQRSIMQPNFKVPTFVRAFCPGVLAHVIEIIRYVYAFVGPINFCCYYAYAHLVFPVLRGRGLLPCVPFVGRVERAKKFEISFLFLHFLRAWCVVNDQDKDYT